MASKYHIIQTIQYHTYNYTKCPLKGLGSRQANWSNAISNCSDKLTSVDSRWVRTANHWDGVPKDSKLHLLDQLKSAEKVLLSTSGEKRNPSLHPLLYL